MAWKQLDALVLNGVTYNCSKLSDSAFQWASTRNSQQLKNDYDTNPVISVGNGFFGVISRADISNYTNIDFFFNNETTMKLVYADFSGSYANTAIYFEKNDDTLYFYCNAGGTNKYPICFGIGVDHENQKAFLWSSNENGLNSNFAVQTMDNFNPTLQTMFYNAIMGSQPVLYNWTSVPAISGKNGILSLSTLKSGSINNGNPVSDATLNAFEILIEASNVGKLVLDTDIDESQVVIRYNIPNNTYQYIKLVYKENYAPENISDGVAIDIQQTDTQLVLDDITTTGTYYFKIFTDNGNSNTVVLNYVGIIPIIIKIERVW